MRIVALVLFALTAACQSCPDGNAGDSLFCHAANCRAEEAVCAGACSNPMNDRDNCGRCGNRCGDGLVCSFGQCVEGCDNGLVNCAGSCVDVASDPNHCMTCGNTCTSDQSCITGACGCKANEVTCGGVCTDPATNKMNCGAKADCMGANAGTQCSAIQACVNGGCLFTTVYRGSLPATTGRWTFQGMLGLNGANAACAAAFPGSAICPYSKLMMAQAKGELTNAVDTANNPVTEWWIDDPAAVNDLRCASNADMIPWSYATADQGHVGKFVQLNRPAGTIGAVITAALGNGCNINRFVPCCSINVAP